MGKKRKSTGSLRGFFLLIALIITAFFIYQYRNGNATVDIKLRELTEKAKSAVTNAGTSADVTPSINQLEIPISTSSFTARLLPFRIITIIKPRTGWHGN